jgi:hypothetical protein
MTSFVKVALLTLLCGLLNACGGGGGGTASTPGSGTPPVSSSNVMAVVVDSGVTGNAVNQLFASVKVCQPGDTSRCQTIDHLLVDTGSIGLRVFASAIPSSVNLPRLTVANGMPLLDCVQFIDLTYAWGPVASADLVMGDKTVSNVPIQIIADPTYSRPNSLCSSRGTATELTTPASLGANGILGLGLSKEDCGADCVNNPYNGSYFACTTVACTATLHSTAAMDRQVKHPVPLFATDNNGLLIDLPAVPSLDGATQLSGQVIFGINTQTNNQLTSESLLTTDAQFGYITTNLSSGSQLVKSFIDSGSNGLFFDSATLPSCGASGFYCPSAQLDFSASLVGLNNQSVLVKFSVLNASTMSRSFTALPALAGPISDAQTFDWGLPFFYGRKVFIGIEGTVKTQGTGPFYAFK